MECHQKGEDSIGAFLQASAPAHAAENLGICDRPRGEACWPLLGHPRLSLARPLPKVGPQQGRCWEEVPCQAARAGKEVEAGTQPVFSFPFADPTF